MVAAAPGQPQPFLWMPAGGEGQADVQVLCYTGCSTAFWRGEAFMTALAFTGSGLDACRHAALCSLFCGIVHSHVV